MPPHVSPQQLHFPPATPPRSEPAQLSPGCRPDFLPASLFNTYESVPAIFQPALSGVVVRTPSKTSIPCSTLPARRPPREACRRALFCSLIFLSPPGRIVAKHISPLAYGSVSLLAARCPRKAIRKYYSNLIRIRSCKVAQSGFRPQLRMSARRLADRASCRQSPWTFKGCAHRRDDLPMSPQWGPTQPKPLLRMSTKRLADPASCRKSPWIFKGCARRRDDLPMLAAGPN